MDAPARSTEQRVADTLHRLVHDVDAWVATAATDGEPCMVPLSYLWDGTTLLFSTAASNPTARNAAATGKVRVGIGLTRDVVLLEGTVSVLETVPSAEGDAFAVKTGFDPRTLRGRYVYLRVTPLWMQAWREVNELAGRDLPLPLRPGVS